MELTARVNKLLEIRQKVDSLLFKTIKNFPSDFRDTEIFCPKERIKELEIRTQQRNDFEEELFKDIFPTEEELAYHRELLDEPKPPFSTREPKIRRGEVVLGKPFVEASKLTYDETVGLIRFAQRDDEVMFRMPHRTKVIDLVSPLEKDKLEAFFVDSLKIRKKKDLSMSLKKEKDITKLL
nr:protein kinase-like domain, concanavalin A-like lectin/glucanase domain protein [Tanacetum cinerariifolium]